MSIYEGTSNTQPASDVEANPSGQASRDRISQSVASSKATGVPFDDAELAAMQAQIRRRSAFAGLLFVGMIFLWCPWWSAHKRSCSTSRAFLDWLLVMTAARRGP